jgi:hypothetical protein
MRNERSVTAMALAGTLVGGCIGRMGGLLNA